MKKKHNLTLLNSFSVDPDFVRIIGMDNESIHVGMGVILAANVFVYEQIFTLVGEYGVHLFGRRTTDVRAEHYEVWGVTME